MHADSVKIDIERAIETDPITPDRAVVKILWGFVIVGSIMTLLSVLQFPLKLLWGIYYSNLLYWMGLSLGGIMVTVIFQIVRAKWSAPVRRLFEAHAGFLFSAYCFFLLTYLGKDYLFTWAAEPMPGREWWMQPNFVYIRHAICLGLLFFLFWRYTMLSLRGDIGLIRENQKVRNNWLNWDYDLITRNWKGSAVEIPELQNRMSRFAPVLVMCYAVIYSLFAFEMVMGMNQIWFSNLFGAFLFIGNIYLAWAITTILAFYLTKKSPALSKNVGTQQFWDLGKLTFAFCMLWGYFVFSQFLVQWYGNLPEETQWLILRTREYPWKGLAWLVFGMCFVVPFIILMSRDVKRTPKLLAAIVAIPAIGILLERYLLVMPELNPDFIPFGLNTLFAHLGVTALFFGTYFLSYFSFLSKYPFINVSSPLARNSAEW